MFWNRLPSLMRFYKESSFEERIIPKLLKARVYHPTSVLISTSPQTKVMDHPTSLEVTCSHHVYSPSHCRLTIKILLLQSCSYHLAPFSPDGDRTADCCERVNDFASDSKDRGGYVFKLMGHWTQNLKVILNLNFNIPLSF